jgi:cell division protease FtsH
VRTLVDNAHDKALAILRHNRELLESISQQILEKEVIEGDNLKELLASSVLPEQVQVAA